MSRRPAPVRASARDPGSIFICFECTHREPPMPMPKAREVTVSIPGWLSIKLTPNDAERKAAWQLYVELATRVATQPMNRDKGSLRAVLDSLYSVFTLTRSILREGGPDLAPRDNSFGPLAIRFLTDVLAPFLLEWHEALRQREHMRPPEAPPVLHERSWERYGEMCAALTTLQTKVGSYVDSLAAIAGVHTELK
jgi:hypothetical protein